ncbi:MAG: hypothetical protein IT497_00935 [Ottowia sp.]|nr:hypothetical protein [Ottowia sp.]
MWMPMGGKRALFLKQIKESKYETRYQRRKDKDYFASQQLLNALEKTRIGMPTMMGPSKQSMVYPWHEDEEYAQVKKAIDKTQHASQKIQEEGLLTCPSVKKMYPWQQFLLLSAISSVITTKPEHESVIHKRLAEKMMRAANEAWLKERAQSRETRATYMKSRFSKDSQSTHGEVARTDGISVEKNSVVLGETIVHDDIAQVPNSTGYKMSDDHSLASNLPQRGGYERAVLTEFGQPLALVKNPLTALHTNTSTFFLAQRGDLSARRAKRQFDTLISEEQFLLHAHTMSFRSREIFF